MFDSCLYFNTQALARVLEREWSIAFAPFGLTSAQAFMLRAILRQPGLLQRELAAGLVLSKPTVTRLLDTLQAKGMIERRNPGTDGREWAIFPTEKAQALHQDLDQASGSVTSSIKRQISTDVFADVVSKVREVRSTLE